MALEAEPRRATGRRHRHQPARRGAACRARRRAPSGRARARGRRRRPRGFRAGRRRPSARRRRPGRSPRPKPTRSPSSAGGEVVDDARVAHRLPARDLTRPAALLLLVVDLPDTPVDVERSLVLGQRRRPARTSIAGTAGGATTARHAGRAPAHRHRGRARPPAGARRRPRGRRPADPPLDLAQAARPPFRARPRDRRLDVAEPDPVDPAGDGPATKTSRPRSTVSNVGRGSRKHGGVLGQLGQGRCVATDQLGSIRPREEEHR